MGEISGFLARPDGHRLAFRRIEGAGPTVIWFGGFASDLSGTKAQALADWARAGGHSYLRFDYFAHGASSGDFAEATVGRWREDALAVIEPHALKRPDIGAAARAAIVELLDQA